MGKQKTGNTQRGENRERRKARNRQPGQTKELNLNKKYK